MAAEVAARVSTLSVADLQAPPLEVAARILPQQLAGRVVDGTVFHHRHMPGRNYSVSFWEMPEPVGPRLCRRRVHGTMLRNPTAPYGDDPAVVLAIAPIVSGDQVATTFPQPATQESCRTARSYVSTSSFGNTAAALERLTAAMVLAAGPEPLPFVIHCRADERSDACRDARSSLAKLRLENMYRVAFETDAYRTLEERPATAAARGFAVRQMVAPEGRPATPTIEFGPSGPDGRSWRITLIGRERLEEIRMERAAVIYH